MGLWSKKILALVAIIFILIMLTMKFLFDRQVDASIESELSQYSLYMQDSIESLTDEKRKITEALAVAFSSPLDLRKSLTKDPATISQELKTFTESLRKYSAYKKVWVQLLNSDGVSLGRSWSKKHGDDLTKVRLDVASAIKKPRRINSLSVGKFSLSFKTIIPLYDEKDTFIGLVDVISQVDSIDQSLNEISGVRSIVLVHDSYKSQLTKVDRTKFIGNYYIANEAASVKDIDMVSKIHIDNLFKTQGYLRQGNSLITADRINNIQGEPMALWLVIKPINTISFKQTEKRQTSLLVIYSFILLLFISLVAVFYLQYKTSLEKKFFSQFFENSTEEICIFNESELIETNQRFLGLFFEANTATIETFYQKYDSVSDVFVDGQFDEESFFNGKFWLAYLLDSTDGVQMKINTLNEVETFIVKASKIDSSFGSEYTVVLMTNITKEVLYQEKLEKLVVTDELTGIHNRHYFNTELLNELKRAKRYDEMMSLLVVDIDYFKQINDQFGHDVGDETLIKVTEVLAENLRETDKFCRVGGEEFVIIMPMTNLESALLLAERLRGVVESLLTNVVPKKITISLGLTEFKQWDTFNSIYKRADMALYKAKQNGRNRIEIINENGGQS